MKTTTEGQPKYATGATREGALLDYMAAMRRLAAQRDDVFRWSTTRDAVARAARRAQEKRERARANARFAELAVAL